MARTKFSGPQRLSAAARKKYRELEPQYAVNSPIMVETLAQWCELWEKYIRAEEELKTAEKIAPKDGLAEHGAMKTQLKCLDSMRRLAKLLEDNGKPVNALKEKKADSLMDRLKL